MTTQQRQKRRKWATGVLESALTPLDKVRKLIALGYEEIDAEAMVTSLQMGSGQMVYYEQLPSPEYDEDLED